MVRGSEKLNWKLEVDDSDFRIITNYETNENCWNYAGMHHGIKYIGCICKTKEECFREIEGYLINRIIHTENILKFKKEGLEKFRRKMKKEVEKC